MDRKLEQLADRALDALLAGAPLEINYRDVATMSAGEVSGEWKPALTLAARRRGVELTPELMNREMTLKVSPDWRDLLKGV